MQNKNQIITIKKSETSRPSANNHIRETKNNDSVKYLTSNLFKSNRQNIPERKRPSAAPVDDFSSLMAKAEQNRKIDPKKLEDEILMEPLPKKTLKQNSTKDAHEVGVTAGKTLNYCGVRSLAKKERDEFDDIINIKGGKYDLSGY